MGKGAPRPSPLGRGLFFLVWMGLVGGVGGVGGSPDIGGLASPRSKKKSLTRFYGPTPP